MQEPKYYLVMILWDLKKTFKTFQKTSKFKGNAQFVKNKTFGLWEKMITQLQKMFYKIPMNAHATICVKLFC